MANEDVPKGFSPYGLVYPPYPYRKASGAVAVYRGDLLIRVNDGTVTLATAGSTILCGASRDYYASGSAYTSVMVYDDVDQKFTGQDDGDSATPAVTTLGLNADHVQGTGSAVTFLSGHEIDISTATTATAGLRLLEFVRRDDNDPTDDNAEWVVLINEHWLNAATGT